MASVLSLAERRELECLMLSGVLCALSGAGLLDKTHVVTSDPRIIRLAAGSGAGTVREDHDGGVNAAVRAGVRALDRPSRVMVLPSDLPLLRASDVRHLLWLGGLLQVVVAPSATLNGTNALLFPPNAGLDLSYDRDSFWNHVRGCGRKGLSVGVASRPGLSFDLDSPEDLRSLAGMNARNPAAEFARGATR